MAGVEQIVVEPGEAGMRLDRWFKVHFPGLGFGHLQKLLRSGQVRVDGGRVKADTRVEPGQTVRIPPLEVDKKGETQLTGHSIRNQGDADVLAKMLLHEDPKVFVFNKPAGLAVQGGSGVTRNVDDMLEAWRNEVAAVWPDLAVPGVLDRRLLDAQLLWVWLCTWWFLPRIRERDTSVGPETGRSPRISTALCDYWRRLGAAAADAEGLGATVELAESITTALRARFSDAPAALPLYPAFRSTA